MTLRYRGGGQLEAVFEGASGRHHAPGLVAFRTADQDDPNAAVYARRGLRLGIGLAKGAALCQTSPVLFISGPRIGSAFRELVNGNGFRSPRIGSTTSVAFPSIQPASGHDARADLGERHARGLDTTRRARGPRSPRARR